MDWEIFLVYLGMDSAIQTANLSLNAELLFINLYKVLKNDD